MGRRQYKMTYQDYDNHLEVEKRTLYMERSSVTNSIDFHDDEGNHLLTVNMDMGINILDAMRTMYDVNEERSLHAVTEGEECELAHLVSDELTKEEMLKIFKHE